MTVKIFICYAHEDEALLNQLKRHLKPLQRQGLIDLWHDRDISAGMEWEQEINQQLDSAHIILLLVSPNFMDSDYCYSIEMKKAIERHERGEVRVIPIILRHVYWQGAPFGKLQALPADAEPVAGSRWRNLNVAFFNVTEGIQKVVEELASPTPSLLKTDMPTTLVVPALQLPQLSNEATISPENVPEPIAPTPSSLSEESVISPNQLLMSDTRTIPSGWSKRIPRRAVVLGLTGLTLAGGSIIWFILTPKPSPQGTTLHTYTGHSDAVLTVAWSPAGQYIASGGADGTVHVWDASNGNRLFKYVSHSTYGGNVYGVAWSPDSKRVASGYGYYSGWVEVWNVGNQDYYSYEGPANSSGGVRAVAWSRDGKYIASGDGDGTVQVWNADNRKSVNTYPGHSKSTGSFNAVNAVAWSPDGTRIASGSDDKTVQVWDALTGWHVFTYRRHTDAVNAVTWSPDGTRIASGSTDKTVQVWDAWDGAHSYRHPGHTDAVNTVAWSPDGTRIASGSDDKTVQVWQAI